jgi:HAD superfamily hydrolase (TIGR01459 family)
MSEAKRKPPVYIDGLASIADRFDHVLLDQWGVLHDGQKIFAGVRDAIAGLRAVGKRILVLSNSGKRAAENAMRLATLGLPIDVYDGLVTSGEATWQALRRRDRAPFDRLGHRCRLITRGGDRSVVEGLDLHLADGPAADFILLAGVDDAEADPAFWQAELIEAAASGRPMICANPDLSMITPTGLVPAPGRIAALYEKLGGRVTYVGKPHPPIYAECLALLGDPEPARVLAVGDSLDHDILGGRRMGMPTALVIAGVHAPAFETAKTATQIVGAAEKLAARTGAVPDWLMPSLTW